MFAGEEFDFTDYPKKDTTIYRHGVLETVAGCDSIVDLTLIVHPSYLFVTDTAVCQNELYNWNTWQIHENVNKWKSGTYYDTVPGGTKAHG